MRLLHYDTQDRLVLTNFYGQNIPRYAILSHRWGEPEIHMEDVSMGDYKEKEESYRKLRFCAEQAAKDGLQYFWIDTCCIDRWDNIERSRSINSMFQWYRKAARCYVFLSDVSLTAVTETTTAPRSEWEATFCASSWFTRGWTLQELIAPESVEFFSREGHRLGDKASLEELIRSVTGIPPAVLRNSPLDQFSTSERMQWANKRETTEAEDTVYCLLGVLGISMPASYGEGQKSALKRLQAELKPNGSAPSMIPFSQNEFFVGRESQLAQLEAKLFSNDQTTTTLAIVGPGGTGKSQLALELAHRTRLNKKDCSVFWIDASDTNSLYRSFASVAQKLGIPGCDDDQADPKQVVKRCVVEVSTQQCLLVFDNVEDTTSRPGASSSTSDAALLAEFLPDSKLCSVIFTTTGSNTAEALAPGNVTTLSELTPKAALTMLRNRLTRSLSDAEQPQAKQLLEELSHLPLAIVQAAAHIEARKMTVPQYQAKLAEHTKAAVENGGGPSEGELGESSEWHTVAATLSVSISQVRQTNAVAADYLCLAVCVNRKDIPLDVLEPASSQAREDAIKLLDRYALVTRRPAESALDVHRLVHQALRKRLQAEGRLREWSQRTIIQLRWLFPSDDHSNRSRWRRLLPHAQFVLSHSQNDDDDDRMYLATKCAGVLYSDGQYKAAEELYVQVTETMKGVFGNEHPNTLISMLNLASTYSDQGRWREAEELEAQVIEIRKRVIGKEHPDTLTSMHSLASTYSDQGRWREAEELEAQVIEARKRVLGNEHPDTLARIDKLALIHGDQGRWREVEELQLQTLEIRKREFGNDHPNTLSSMANLALIYNNQWRWREAEELFVQVVETIKGVLGNEHPTTLASMHNLASTYWYQERWREAEELLVQVIEVKQRVLGNEHYETLTSMNLLASTYWFQGQGRWRETEELQLQVIEIRRRVLGNEHYQTLVSMENMAFTLWSLSRREEAIALMESCIQSYLQVYGEQHPDTQCSLKRLDKWRAALLEDPS